MRVIVGVSGGIAAYKACEVIRRFKELGHSVRVIPTPSALKFVGAATFEALSGEPVSSTVWERVDEVAHVALGQGADLIVVAPATANTISRFAQGSADDLLTSTLLVTRAPILLAPAMHTEMWENPSTQENIATLKRRGVHVLEPAHGRLTGSDSGVGRLPEPIQIVERALSLVLPQDFNGKAFMVTTGGTREKIDPVRFVGNNSSGKQGIAIARAAAARGATVTLIAANVESILLDSLDPKIHIHRVINADEMNSTVWGAAAQMDVVIMAAAVADFRPKSVSQSKIKKNSASGLTIEFESNVDILASLCTGRSRLKSGALLVGFAAETDSKSENLVKLGTEKLRSKSLDLMYVNNVTDGAIFGSDLTQGIIIDSNEKNIDIPEISKDTLSDILLDQLVSKLG